MEQVLSFVCSPENDVLFLLLLHQSNLNCIRLYMFHWSDIIQESSQIYQGLSPYTSYSVFFLKIKYRLLMQNSEEYTDFQHLGSALKLSADHRRSCCKFKASLNNRIVCR